jgi:hypothetical protein
MTNHPNPPVAKVLSIVGDVKKPNRKTNSRPDIVTMTPESIKTWKSPPFQRPIRINQHVHDYSATLIADDGVFPGTPLQLGVWEKETYLVDGQHRREAFLLSGLAEGIANVIYTYYEDGAQGLSDMSDDYVGFNSKLVNLRPDDILRPLEHTSAALQLIRRRCPFVGYDMIRRGPKAPMVSMAAVLRCWFGSSPEVPTTGGISATDIARSISVDEASALVEFLSLTHTSWGGDLEYGRLWGALNLTLCMWLYRRLVVSPYSPRTPRLTKEQFGKCLMSISANGPYIDWLLGRGLRDRDRSPAYSRLRLIIALRLEKETGKKPALPAPAWSHQSGGK